MTTQEYKCESCRVEFTTPGLCSIQTTTPAKCPLCGSTEIRELTESERLYKMALGFQRGG
jgi:DNA-directed RNA polymerase subunit RPC12/RpoP